MNIQKDNKNLSGLIVAREEHAYFRIEIVGRRVPKIHDALKEA